MNALENKKAFLQTSVVTGALFFLSKNTYVRLNDVE